MDFPLFHLDFLGNRMMVAIIAIIHVIINHALAVGFIPLITLMEYRGLVARKLGYSHWLKWDNLAHRVMFVGFIITTSVGALTGVGIWFSTSLANPASIGSLIRIFYFAWFAEWVVFMLEVMFILWYFLSWKNSNKNLNTKLRHVRFGLALSIFSWLTMAIITAILGFMMDPGKWLETANFFHGFTNPIYVPQLIFRTPVAMIMGGCFILFIALFYLKKNDPVRDKAIRLISGWILLWTPYTLLASYLYYYQIPTFMIGNLPVAIGTQAFQKWYDTLLLVLVGSVIIAFLTGTSGLFFPKKVKKWVTIIPLVVSVLFLGSFERIREFVRKPYVINDYMYANGLLKEDYPLYQRGGILAHTTFLSGRKNQATPLEKGENVFRIACTRCHTTDGVNGILANFTQMYGDTEWDNEAMQSYIHNMHNVRTYMPPFPGNQEELHALTNYILSLKKMPGTLDGAQSEGITVNPLKH